MNGELPSLDLALVTHRADGIRRVEQMLLPPMEGVRYIVSWQNHDNASIPQSLAERTDVEIHQFDGKGISANRNNSLDKCRADIVLFSDDDLIYEADELNALRRYYAENRKADLVTLISRHGDMSRFPSSEMRLSRHLPKNYSVASFEISFRRASVGHLRCCPELGLGSDMLHGGEDEIFVLSAIRQGLDCRFVPLEICTHPGDSTGTKARLTPGNLKACGCVIALTYPYSAWIRVPLKAWRAWRQGQASAFVSFKNLLQGALMAPGVYKRNKKYLW